MTLYEIIENNARVNPGRTAWSYFNKSRTYGEFINDINNTAAGLKDSGISKGDRVAITALNSPEAITSVYALNKLGAVVVMLNPKSPTAELHSQIKLTQAKAVIYTSLTESALVPALEDTQVEIAVKINSLNGMSVKFQVGCVWKKLTSGDLKRPVYPQNIRFTNYSKLQIKQETETNRDDLSDAVIFFGGGSSGRLRAVVHSSRAIDLSAMNCLSTEKPMQGGEVMLAMLPAFHMFGFVVVIHIAFRGSMKCVLIPIFEKNHCAKLFVKEKVTFTAGVPVLFSKVLSTGIIEKAVENGKRPFENFRHGFCGGDVMNEELREKVNTLLKKGGAEGRIDSGYGMTECCPVTLCRSDKYSSNSLGIPFPGMEVSIFEPSSDIPVKDGEDGELCIRSESVLLRSFDLNGTCYDSLYTHSDGTTWLHTGDMARKELDGTFTFICRLKRLIKVSGNTALATDIEAVCDSLPYVEKSYAISIPDKQKQNAVKLYAAIREDVDISDPSKMIAEINELYKNSMAPWSRPVKIVLCRDRDIPRTAMTKIAWGKLEKDGIKGENNENI